VILNLSVKIMAPSPNKNKWVNKSSGKIFRKKDQDSQRQSGGSNGSGKR